MPRCRCFVARGITARKSEKLVKSSSTPRRRSSREKERERERVSLGDEASPAATSSRCPVARPRVCPWVCKVLNNAACSRDESTRYYVRRYSKDKRRVRERRLRESADRSPSRVHKSTASLGMEWKGGSLVTLGLDGRWRIYRSSEFVPCVKNWIVNLY